VPFFRPPYGHHNTRTDRVAADLGHPTIALWEGSLSDSSVITEDFLLGQARLWFQPQHIIIGHANHPAVTHTYPQLLDIIGERGLRTVTLADVFRAAP
jgi:peptidoglycan/xylan/chitin deacetylase (PgdA/CDA1 family)